MRECCLSVLAIRQPLFYSVPGQKNWIMKKPLFEIVWINRYNIYRISI